MLIFSSINSLTKVSYPNLVEKSTTEEALQFIANFYARVEDPRFHEPPLPETQRIKGFKVKNKPECSYLSSIELLCLKTPYYF